MKHRYLWELRPYFRQVAGELIFGSLCGVVMNTTIVLPAVLLGRAIAGWDWREAPLYA